MPLPEPDILIENPNGVIIYKELLLHGHHYVANAFCFCGKPLMVAPALFRADHKKGDPVVVCEEYGQHAYRFSDLVIGHQLSVSVSEDENYE